jgi:hypothetical protein
LPHLVFVRPDAGGDYGELEAVVQRGAVKLSACVWVREHKIVGPVPSGHLEVLVERVVDDLGERQCTGGSQPDGEAYSLLKL